MRILQRKKLYLRAFSIVAVVLLLLVLISVSTFRNLNRDKTNALKFIHRHGLALIRTLEAGARVGMIQYRIQNWSDSVGRLIHEMGHDPDIAYVYLMNRQGTIISHSDPSQEGRPSNLENPCADLCPVSGRIRMLSNSTNVYELTKCFAPFRPAPKPSNQDGKTNQQADLSHSQCQTIIVLALKMAIFEEARHTDFYHALIMAGFVVALGSGALFFLSVIQNYYLVDRPLKETQDYTNQVVASMVNGLLSFNPKGEVVSYNLIALDLLGLEEADIRGKNFKHFIDFEASGIQQTLTQ